MKIKSNPTCARYPVDPGVLPRSLWETLHYTKGTNQKVTKNYWHECRMNPRFYLKKTPIPHLQFFLLKAA